MLINMLTFKENFPRHHHSIILFYKLQRPGVRENFFQTYSVRRVEMNESKNMYVTVAFAGVALMVALLIGVVVMRRRNTRYPHHQVVQLSWSYPPTTLFLSPSLLLHISFLSISYTLQNTYNTNTVHCSEIFINFIFFPMNVKWNYNTAGLHCSKWHNFWTINWTQTNIDWLISWSTGGVQLVPLS